MAGQPTIIGWASDDVFAPKTDLCPVAVKRALLGGWHDDRAAAVGLHRLAGWRGLDRISVIGSLGEP